jgi:glycerophosphoryl diester phosphodiesterase
MIGKCLLIALLFLAGCASGPAKPEIHPIKDTIMAKNESVVVMAHRGFRGIAPENTLLAALKGYESGADYWELDVAASADGTLVVLHDDSLRRTTDVASRYPGRDPWSVFSFTLAEIKSLSAGAWYEKADPFKQIAAGRVKKADLADFRELRVPTLEEALRFTKEKGWMVNVEIKDATGEACDPWIVESTAALIRSLAMADSVVVSSFNHEYLLRMKAAAPEIRRAALIDKPIADPIAVLKRLDAVALNPNYKYLDEKTVREVRSAGFHVYVWTPNEKTDMERLVAWGVSGLITDFPDRALEILGRAVGRP